MVDQHIYTIAEVTTILGRDTSGESWIRKLCTRNGIGNKIGGEKNRGTWMLTEGDIVRLRKILSESVNNGPLRRGKGKKVA